LYAYVRNCEYGIGEYNNSFSSVFEDTSWIINGVFRRIKDCGYHASDALVAHLPKAYKYSKKHNLPFNVPKVIIEDNVVNHKAKKACMNMAEHNDKERFNEEFSMSPLGKMEQHLTNACGLKITERYPFTNTKGYCCVATHVEFLGEIS